MSRDSDRDEAVLSAHARLIEALAADLLGAPDAEILGSHTPSAARVAADALRQRLRRGQSGGDAAATPADRLPPDPPSKPDHRPEKKP